LLRLDIGQPLPADLLLQAARRGLEAKDLSLAERLARCAVDAGGGPRALKLLAIVHYRQARGEEVLADISGIETADDLELTELAVLQASVLIWILGRVAEAER